MSAPAAALTPDLVAGLRRLKLARIRAIAPEVCQSAKTQRWAPDKVLRTLIEAEIAARDDSNLRGRLKQAGFPVVKRLDDFKSRPPPCRRRPSTTSRPWNGSRPKRTSVWLVPPAPASRIF
jgi:DNA replication protein DnaC